MLAVLRVHGQPHIGLWKAADLKATQAGLARLAELTGLRREDRLA